METSVLIIYPVSTVDELKSVICHPETLKGGRSAYTCMQCTIECIINNNTCNVTSSMSCNKTLAIFRAYV